MNRLYLVRHGENWANLTLEFSYRRIDYSLTPKGRLQAEQTAGHFAGRGIHEIYTSPLKRARETAGIIAARLGLGVAIIEGLREINVGDLEDRPPSAESWAINFQVVHDWMAGQRQVAFPGGEDLDQLWARMRAAVVQMVTGKDGQSIIAVAHGGVLRCTLPDLCPGVDRAWLDGHRSQNCSITEVLVDLRDGRPEGRLITWASHAHLHGEAAELVPGVPDERALDEGFGGGPATRQ